MLRSLGGIRIRKSKNRQYNDKNVIYKTAGADPGEVGGVPPKIGEKKKIFSRKIVIFHTKYPNNFRASLHSAQFF